PELPSAVAARNARRDAGARLLLLLPALAVLPCAAAISWRSAPPGAWPIAALAGVVLAGRLAARGLLPWLENMPLFDYRLFSSPVPFPLAASPGDLLATCLAALALTALAVLLLRRAGTLRRAVALGLGAVAAAALWRITPAWISDSSLNPVLSPFHAPVGPRLALVAAHAALAFASGILVIAAVAPARLRSGQTLAILWLAAAS